MKAIAALGLIFSVAFAGCSAPLHRTALSSDGVQATNNTMNTAYVADGGRVVSYSGKYPLNYVSVSKDGIESVSSAPTTTMQLDFGMMTLTTNSAQNVSIGEVSLEWDGENFEELPSGARRYVFRDLRMNGSSVIEAQSPQVEAEVKAAMAMSGDARKAYIQRLKTLDSVVGAMVEAIVVGMQARIDAGLVGVGS